MGGEASLRRRLAAAACLLLALSVAPSSQALACEPAPPSALLPSASAPGVEAVVEHLVLARNPLPWGRSAAVVTRVWGTALVERWLVTDTNSHPCPGIRTEPRGRSIYLFPGGGGVPEVVREGPVTGLEAAALTDRFGAPEVLAVSSVDRVMAWVRVFPGVILGALVLAALVAGLVVRLRRRRRRPYLF